MIIPTLDRADDLDECLRALGRSTIPRDRLEVIVVDDGSADAGRDRRASPAGMAPGSW